METTTKNKREKKKGEPLFRQNPNVDEVTRIRISQILEHFRASNDEGYSVPPFLIFSFFFTVSCTKNTTLSMFDLRLQNHVWRKNNFARDQDPCFCVHFTFIHWVYIGMRAIIFPTANQSWKDYDYCIFISIHEIWFFS